MNSKANERAFAAMIEESKRLSWPIRFKADLTTHDRAAVARLASGEAFLWAIHESGTHLYPLGYRDGMRHGPADFIGTIRECSPGVRFYIWDGVSLIGLAPKEAAACVREMEASL